MLVHIHHRCARLAVCIGCGLESCGSAIDRFRPLSVVSEIELFSSLPRSVSADVHIGRISCCLADFWAAASLTLAAVSCLITCSMCVSACAHVFCGWITGYMVCMFDFCPRRGSCMRRPVICFLLWLPLRRLPGTPLHVSLLYARHWLAARPAHLSSVSSSHFLSLPAHRKASLMSGWL